MRQLYSCDQVDARSPTDVWLLLLDTVCHFDGSAWSCRYLGGYKPYFMQLTGSHVWFTGGLGSSPLLVMDTTVADAPITPVGEGASFEYGLDLKAVPGAEQVWLSVPGITGSSYALFDPTGQIRKQGGGATRDLVPLGPDHEYLLDVTTDDCLQSTASTCSSTASWSQLVVSEYKSGVPTPLAHLDDLTGDHVPRAGRMVGGALYIDGTPAYRLP